MFRRAMIPALATAAATAVFVTAKGAPLIATMQPVGPDIRLACDDFARSTRLQQSVGRPAEFLQFLAETCREATRSVEGGAGAEELASAWILLHSLADFRETIVRMNAARLEAARTNPDGPLRLVSETGAYLIAREMGLLDRREAWALAAGEAVAGR